MGRTIRRKRTRTRTRTRRHSRRYSSGTREYLDGGGFLARRVIALFTLRVIALFTLLPANHQVVGLGSRARKEWPQSSLYSDEGRE